MPVANEEILRQIEAGAASLAPGELMERICGRLAKLPNFNWVGFYLVVHEGGVPMLHLGPFVGAPTPHTRIPLNQGICGAAVSQAKTIVVDDVNSDPRYLACSLETKSEIVAPIHAHGQIVGEIDIDSHAPAAFGAAERELVERCARLVGEAIEKQAA